MHTYLLFLPALVLVNDLLILPTLVLVNDLPFLQTLVPVNSVYAAYIQNLRAPRVFVESLSAR